MTRYEALKDDLAFAFTFVGFVAAVAVPIFGFVALLAAAAGGR